MFSLFDPTVGEAGRDRTDTVVVPTGAVEDHGRHLALDSSQSDTAGSNVLTGRFGHYFKFGAGPSSRSRLSAGSWQNSSKLSIDPAALCEGVEARLSGLIHAFPNVNDEALHASAARRRERS